MFNDEKLLAVVVGCILVVMWVAIHFGPWLDKYE